MTVQNSPARSGIDVGAVIADTYTLEALIGRGGMGAVFLASHKRLPGKKVAIKMLHAELENDELLARFKREAEIASRLGHPNIVAVHDFNVLPDGTPYLVLELLEGETLAQRLKQGPIPLDHALTIVRQIGSALAAAHREGIVHRDLKPQNIFLVPTEVQGRVVEIAKVLDFGISKIRGSQTVKTQDSTLLGTPQYMAPEQATGQHANVDERTDVFALGAIVYEMLAGKPAFSGASIPEVVFKVVYEQPAPLDQIAKDLPPEIYAAIKRAMAKSLDERFGNVSAFVEALTGQPLSIIRPGSNSLPPDTSSPSSKARANSAGSEAFAQTMGSGDHGESPIGGVEATASVKSLVRGSAPTIDSQNNPAAVPVQTSVAQPQRSHAILIAGVIGSAAIAAIAMYFVMRSPSEPATPPNTSTVAQILVAADAALQVSVPPPVQGSATPPPAPPPVVKKIEVPPKKIETTDAKKKIEVPVKQGAATDAEDTAADETTKQKLKEAESILTSDPSRAEQLANTVIVGESGTEFQKQQAHTLRGIVMCTRHNDAERAMIDFRQITIPKFSRRVIAACRSAGLNGVGQ